ncbi:MAG TPA: response regulator, partial [Acidimicrobiales bacterium]|nr:response regulator [Acidimicrobiales bacterium]
GIDGLDVARAVAADPALADVRTVLLTSSAQRGELRRSREAGVHGYLTKPVRHSHLRGALATVLAGGEAGEDLVTQDRLAEARNRRRARLLLAEDNPVNQKVAARMAEKLGFGVDVAPTGVEAVEAVAEHSYAAVLMDVQMPRMDGYQATAAIRAREPDGSRIPIIAMTASAMEGDRERCLAAGMDDYLPKPLREDDLATALARWAPVDGEKERPVPEESPRARPDVPATGDVLDPGEVEKLRDLGARSGIDMLAELGSIYAQETPPRLAALRAAVAAGDAVAVREQAHTIKGTAVALGASGLAEQAARLEAMGREGRLEGAEQLVDEVEAESERVARALDVSFTTEGAAR